MYVSRPIGIKPIELIIVDFGDALVELIGLLLPL